MAQKYKTIDEYISSFPDDVQAILQEVRATIHAAVPGAGEAISYHMPTITAGEKSIVTFAGWKKHIALYPAPAGDADFEREIAPYRTKTSTLNFPLSKPIPFGLIGRAAALLAEQSSG